MPRVRLALPGVPAGDNTGSSEGGTGSGGKVTIPEPSSVLVRSNYTWYW